MNGYAYTDAQMLMATQVAYLDVPEGWTVGEYAQHVVSTVDAAGGKNAVSGKLADQYETIKDMSELARQDKISGWENWTVVDSCDHNNSSGMYGCLIDTGDGNAIVGFRGSESFDTYQDIVDWGVADAGMLNSQLTQQQYEASRYTRSLWERYGDRYESFSFTGHSLGGNLAEHATITAPAAMRSHIDHTISYDGPGFPEEYLADHAADIRASRDSITHYRWSFVGAILTQPDGVDDILIEADIDTQKGDETHKLFGIDTGVKECILWTHHTKNVHIKEGSVVPAGPRYHNENTEFMDLVHEVTNAADSNWTTAGLYLIPIIGPIYAGADIYNRISSARRSTKEHAQRSMENLKDIINSIMNTIFRQFNTPYVSGEFEMDCARAHAIGTEIDSMGHRTRQLIKEIEDVQRSLQFDSISGSYYKTQLWCMCNQLTWDAQAIERAAGAIQSCSLIYKHADTAVSEAYI